MNDADATITNLMLELPRDGPSTRAALVAGLQHTLAQGGASAARCLAAAVVVHTAIDFADFRSLMPALKVLAAQDRLNPGPPLHSLVIDAALLTRPAFDHTHSHHDPGLKSARQRLFEAVRSGANLAPDMHLLLAKMLVDHDSMVGDVANVERVLALMQERLRAGDASPVWQARWWLLLAENAEWSGHLPRAREALAQARQIATQFALADLLLACAIGDMAQALREHHLWRADRVFAQIEQLRPHVQPALLPRGLRAQTSLQLRRGEFAAVIERTRLMLDLCVDHEVPERDRAGYVEQHAHALTGLQRHGEAVALLESLRPTQRAAQGQVLEAVIAMASAVQALAECRPDARERGLAAIVASASAGHHRFLMSFPGWAAQIAAIGLDAGVETEFLTHSIRERRLPPPDPAREQWPWALHVEVLGRLRVRRDGSLLSGHTGKAQKKPMELLALLAAHPEGLDAATLINALWPSLDAEAPKSSLEMAISRLRKALDLADSVRVADGRVALNPALVWTDVVAFEAACSRQQVDAALLLYAGPLLHGETLSPALHAARSGLAARLTALLLSAGGALTAQGRQVEAIALYARGLALEPGAQALRLALRTLLPPD